MLVQSLMFFILGVSVAVFFVILVAPFIWRRVMFFARKILRHQMPFSYKELEADRKFLCAQHAIEIARHEERCKLLQRINDEQKLQLYRNQEYMRQLQDLQGNTDSMAQQIIDHKKYLNHEAQRVESVILSQNKNAQQVSDLFFNEKLTRIDVATYEQELVDMNLKLELLQSQYNQLKQTLSDLQMKQEICKI